MASLNLRTSYFTSIKRVHKLIKSGKCPTDKYDLEQQLTAVSSHYERFTLAHVDLISSAEQSEMEAHTELFNLIEDCYNETCSMIRRKLS